MSRDECTVGYKRPPVHTRFKKGQSGNLSGRPKKTPDLLEDAALIFSAPITGHANGKRITVSAAQAMFRRLCREALKGDNAALRRVIELMLRLEPMGQQQGKQSATINGDAKRKLASLLGVDLDIDDDRSHDPDPRLDELRRQADAMAKKERRRLIREERRRQQ